MITFEQKLELAKEYANKTATINQLQSTIDSLQTQLNAANEAIDYIVLNVIPALPPSNE